jgi:hypothetical protein
LLKISGPADNGDPGVALIKQVLDCETAALDVISGYRAKVGLVSGTIQKHDRDPAKLKLSDPLGEAPDGCEQHSANPLLHQNEQLSAFTIGFLRAISNLNGIAAFMYAVLGANDEISVKGIGDIHYDHANGAAPAGPKLTRRLIGNPTKLCDRKLHAAARRLRNDIRRVQDI